MERYNNCCNIICGAPSIAEVKGLGRGENIASLPGLLFLGIYICYPISNVLLYMPQ